VKEPRHYIYVPVIAGDASANRGARMPVPKVAQCSFRSLKK